MTSLPALLVVLGCSVTLGVTVSSHAQSAATEGATEIDRELVVRFTRAYGMAKEALEQHLQDAPSGKQRDAMLRQPDELDPDLQQELGRILDLNGLQRDQWEMMFARMEADEDLRRRVQSLSTPFE